MLPTRAFLVLTCIFIINIDSATSRSKSKKRRTTTQDSRTTTSKSVLDLPQNDIYNNRVEEDINVPIIPIDPYTNAEKSKMSWDFLNRNNDRKASPPLEKSTIRPQGPPGGALMVMKQAAMTKEFKKMVKNAARKKARKLIRAKCPTCDVKGLDEDVLSFFYPGVEDKIKTVNRSPTAFTTRLLSKIDIYPSSENLVLMKNFQLTGSKYGSLRGVPADLGINGKFQIGKSGIYQITTTLNIHSRHKVAPKSRSNFVQAFICPNGQCSPTASDKNLAVNQYTHSMDSRQRYFTIQLTAMLTLKKGDYISIYVKNACRRTIDIQQGSLMTGIMLSL